MALPIPHRPSGLDMLLATRPGWSRLTTAFSQRVKNAAVDASCGDTSVHNELSLCFRKEEVH